MGRVRLGWPTLGRWILARLTATGCSGSKGRYGSYRLVYVYVTLVVVVVSGGIGAGEGLSLSFPIVSYRSCLSPSLFVRIPSFFLCLRGTRES